MDEWTWPYYYAEIAAENLKWKHTLEWILIVLFSISMIAIFIRIIRIFHSKYSKSRFELVEVLAVTQSIRTGGVDKIISSKYVHVFLLHESYYLREEILIWIF